MADRIVRSRSPSRFVKGAKRETQWLAIASTQVSMGAVGGQLLNSLNAAALALRPFTVVRVHLRVHLESDQIAATEFQAAAIGMAVVSDQASAIGVTAVPTPTTDSGSDLWLLHKFMTSSVMVGAADGNIVGLGFDIDSKAMRKVEDGSDLVLVTEFDAIGSGVTVTTLGRFLIKLH